jgi:GAF domain-containing protein
MRELELLELQHNEGPCPEAFRSGVPVQCADLRDAVERWPTFAPQALAAGFRSVHALPMRLRDDVIGALNLMRGAPGSLPPDDLDAAQALANVATIGILHHRAAEESRVLSEQLQHALTSRIIIEQATGVVAQRLSLDMDAAFNKMRRYSRDHNLRLSDVARRLVERSLNATELIRRT